MIIEADLYQNLRKFKLGIQIG